MNELKRPERYVQFESIKPELKEITEFYTRKVKDYQHCLKQLNEYADALENEISVLKETPTVEVLLDDMPKPLVKVPQFVADWFEDKMVVSFLSVVSAYSFSDYEDIKWIQDNGGIDLLCKMKLYGYTVEKEKKYILKHIDMSKLYTDVSLYLAHGFHKELDHIFYEDVNVYNADECHFTQSEIDKLNTGSYEQIPVEMSDNGI